MLNIVVVGDIMPGGVLPYQDYYIDPALKDYLSGFDLRVGTLEAAVGTGLSYDPEKLRGRQNIVYARDEDLFRVKEMGFDVVSLANNHIWDLDEAGLVNTIRRLKEYGIQYCGAGMNAEEASRPAVVRKDGLSIAFFSYCMYGNKWLGHVRTATADGAGVNALNMDKVIDDIKSAKKQYDKVIILPHWGREYKFKPLPECVVMAKKMVDAGADAVLGSHTHQIQPVIVYKGRPVCFSMGNFLFPDFYMTPPRPIWYPDLNEDLSSIKNVVGYPYPIKEPICQIWNSISRYGRTISLIVNKDSVAAESGYVHMSDSNVLSQCELDKCIQKSLNVETKLLTSRLFRMIYRAKRFLLKLIR